MCVFAGKLDMKRKDGNRKMVMNLKHTMLRGPVWALGLQPYQLALQVRTPALLMDI